MDKSEFVSLCRASQSGPGANNSLLSEQILSLIKDYRADQGDKLPVIWLKTDDSISFRETIAPDLGRLLEEMMSLLYSKSFLAAQGETAVWLLKRTARRKKNRFTLVVEGTMPLTDKLFTLAGRPISAREVVSWLGGLANHVITISTYNSFGATTVESELNNSEVDDLLEQEVINLSGCPAHPDWFVTTLAHLLVYGRPELDRFNRPRLFDDQ